MEFRHEREMLEPARHWLESRGMMTKAEFANPWGICDLVGCSLSPQNVSSRLALRQRRPIGPPLRIAVLRRIPDSETGRTVTLRKLEKDFGGLIGRDAIAGEVDRLVSGRFVRVTARGSFQRLDGWFPLHDRLVTVELKLSRISEALRQAVANRELTHESYAAFPMSVAQRLLGRKDRAEFERVGVGILGLTRRKCRVLFEARRAGDPRDVVPQMHCVERFWRTHVRGN